MVAATSTLAQELMDTEAERTFWEVVRHHERPPFFFPDEGVGNRLNRAARVVTEGRITPNSDGSYTVEGSEGRTYRVTERCSCPNASRGKSHWCYHHVAVVLYIEWQRRLHPVSPVVLGTLRAGTAPLSRADDDEIGNGFPADDQTLPLPLPPTSVDARLAQAAAFARDTVYHAAPLNQLADAPQIPQEDLMPHDAYIPEPEPDAAPVATLEAPVASRALAPVPTATTTLTPVSELEQALQDWTTQRQVVQRFLKQELKPQIDYYTLKIGGRESKPSLSKAGAEKVMGWLKLQASFAPDTGTWEMLGRPQDLVCYVCTLRTRSGEIVGEGRGARSIKKDGGDINKAIKMAEKSANVSAVLRTGCLSDVFTQDLGEEEEEPAPPTPPARPSSQDLRQRIWTLVKQAAPTTSTREDVERYVQRATGYPLHPDKYADIISALEAR